MGSSLRQGAHQLAHTLTSTPCLPLRRTSASRAGPVTSRKSAFAAADVDGSVGAPIPRAASAGSATVGAVGRGVSTVGAVTGGAADGAARFGCVFAASGRSTHALASSRATIARSDERSSTRTRYHASRGGGRGVNDRLRQSVRGPGAALPASRSFARRSPGREFPAVVASSVRPSNGRLIREPRELLPARMPVIGLSGDGRLLGVGGNERENLAVILVGEQVNRSVGADTNVAEAGASFEQAFLADHAGAFERQ